MPTCKGLPVVIEVDGLRVEIVRTSNRRAYLRLRDDGTPWVSAPRHMSEHNIREFVRAHTAWIASARRGQVARASFYENHDPAALKASMAKRLPQIIERSEAEMGLNATSWTLRDMRSRWGSCTVSKRTIRLSVWLEAKPPQCADYVAIHELCHLLVPNHGAAFHALMDEHYPNWRACRALLATY